MKINKILYTVILIVMFVMLISPSICYAVPGSDNNWVTPDEQQNETSTKVPEKVEGNSEVGLPSLGNEYKPSVEMGSATSIISGILSVLIVLGAVATVIGIALVGFGSILGSVGEKAEAQTKIVGIVIAGILITSGSAIAKFLISVAEKI